MSFVETRDEAWEWAVSHYRHMAEKEPDFGRLLTWARGTGGGCGPATPTHEYRGDELRIAAGRELVTWAEMPFRFSIKAVITETVARLDATRTPSGTQGRLL